MSFGWQRNNEGLQRPAPKQFQTRCRVAWGASQQFQALGINKLTALVDNPANHTRLSIWILLQKILKQAKSFKDLQSLNWRTSTKKFIQLTTETTRTSQRTACPVVGGHRHRYGSPAPCERWDLSQRVQRPSARRPRPGAALRWSVAVVRRWLWLDGSVVNDFSGEINGKINDSWLWLWFMVMVMLWFIVTVFNFNG